MSDFSTIEYRLKDIESEARIAGISTVSDSGQVMESPERQKMKAGKTVAKLQGELKQAMMGDKKHDRMAAQKVFDLTKEIAERQKLEKQFDPSKYQAKISDLQSKLNEIKKQFLNATGIIQAAALEKRSLVEDVRKLDQELHVLVNQKQDLQLRRSKILTETDRYTAEREAGRWLGDAQSLRSEERAFRAKEDREKSKIRQYESRYPTKELPRDITERIKHKIEALDKAFNNAKSE